MAPEDHHLHIGAFIFEEMDQMDFTGPFEVLSRVPNSTFHIFGKTLAPIRDARGLILTPTTDFETVPRLDVLVVPGGNGVNRLMEDAPTLEFLRHRAAEAEIIFSICTGALLLGAAGLLRGRRATTHWAAHEFLADLGALPVDARIAIDGNLITAAGVTSGLDAALRVAALLRGDTAAQVIQLYLEYQPDPPFASGSPLTAPAEVVSRVREQAAKSVEERRAISQRLAPLLRNAPLET